MLPPKPWGRRGRATCRGCHSTGNFTATVHHYDGVERWNFSVLPQLVQVVYGGGAVRAAYRQAELGYDIALCDEEFTRLDVRYTAEYTYWNLSAMALYAASMRQYVGIIRVRSRRWWTAGLPRGISPRAMC